MNSPEVLQLFRTVEEIVSLSSKGIITSLADLSRRRLVSPIALGEAEEYFALTTRKTTPSIFGFDIDLVNVEVHEENRVSVGRAVEELSVEIPEAFSCAFNAGDLFLPQLTQWRDYCREQQIETKSPASLLV